MSELRADTVFILGTGATIGSGYSRCGRQLPGDAEFFAYDTVKELLGRYYALDILLDPFRAAHGDGLRDVGVEAVWTYLEFAPQEPYRHIHPINIEVERWLERIRQPGSEAHDEHALVSEWRRNYTQPRPNDIDLWLVAGWDLRRLLARVYDELAEPNGEHNSYGRIAWGHQRLGRCAFVSLNYDLVLESALTRSGVPWFYAHVPTQVPCDKDSVPVLKPHGSLNWRFVGNDPPVQLETDYSLQPVAQRCETTNRFQEALIVPPTQLKQIINAPKTQQPDTVRLFGELFQSTADVLAEASRVVIIGYSFPTTDQHLVTLFTEVNRRRRYQEYERVVWCTLANGSEERKIVERANRLFPSQDFRSLGGGFAALTMTDLIG